MSANLEVGKQSHKCCHGDGVRIDEAIARYERMTEMAKAEYEKWKSKALSLEDLSSSTPYITEDGSYVVFNYFTPKQMAEVYIWLEGGNLHFELTKDEEGQYSLNTKCDIQELDGMFIVGGEEFIVNTIVDSFIVDLKGHKVSEVRIEGIDADLLNADLTWKLAEIGSGIGEINEFFGLPSALPEGYEFMTAEEVCSTLEDIMTSMDLSLTPEQAQAITQQTLTQQ